MGRFYREKRDFDEFSQVSFREIQDPEPHAETMNILLQRGFESSSSSSCSSSSLKRFFLLLGGGGGRGEKGVRRKVLHRIQEEGFCFVRDDFEKLGFRGQVLFT